MLEQTAKTGDNTLKPLKATRPHSRLWEIDTLRGVAIMMMIIYHLLWDINAYTPNRVEVYSGFWWLFARCCATLFVSLSGISLVLNLQSAEKSGKPLFPKILKRAAQVFGCGLIITLVTFFAVPRGTVWFGILHVIGLSMELFNRCGADFYRFSVLRCKSRFSVFGLARLKAGWI
jgi:uncharacterized membrane protein